MSSRLRQYVPTSCHFFGILQVTSALYFNPRTDNDIQRNRGAQNTPKFMQTLDDLIYRELEKIAKRRGITIQELIRAVIVPEWINELNGVESKETGPSKMNNWR